VGRPLALARAARDESRAHRPDHGGTFLRLVPQAGSVLPLVLFPLIFPLVYYITVSETAYRYPIDPILIVLAASRHGMDYTGAVRWTRRATRPERSRRESIVSLLQRASGVILWPLQRSVSRAHRAGWDGNRRRREPLHQTLTPVPRKWRFDGSCFAGAAAMRGHFSAAAFCSVNSVRNFVPLRYILLVAMFRDDAAFAEPEV